MFSFFLALYNGSQVSIVALWATCFSLKVPWRILDFYAPNFEEVWEEYWFGPVFLSVSPSVCYTCTRSRTVRDRILKFGMYMCRMSMKIKKDLEIWYVHV